MRIGDGVVVPAVLRDLPQLPAGVSFGADIDAAHEVLLRPDSTEAQRRAALHRWLARSQPCLFGRLATRQDDGARASRGLGMDVCWIDDDDLSRGLDAVTGKVQRARRRWKDRAVTGHSSAFLIMFNSRRLAYAAPGPELAAAALTLAGTYLVEHAPIRPDVIYTEAVPLRHPDGALRVYKASAQLFHTSAHLRRHHDRRVPGGLLISMNAPGHYAQALVARGLMPDLTEAMAFVRRMALRSIGAGGIGHPRATGSSWRNPAPHAVDGGCPRDGFDPDRYSATYQIDVLVQPEVITDARVRTDGSWAPEEIWPSLHLDYLDPAPTDPGSPEHGWVHGLDVDETARHDNPWPAWPAVNAPDFDY
ncbi:hypothetical protein [Micromonospora coxensis]|uniref:Uncharacterized protein n=1 Tax=Micromonospora coxensis TaxID=356852 RepID=A0A1C5H2R7_9ACTN|nr:hypothetical protein [Micromonospora coxensis]SCG40332.1 hypothetical protein GA0070614_0739 [Micromonospora coxensis]